jgi:imidazolonepropionase-like amidohydrolase
VAKGTVLLRNARLITMRGGEVIPSGDILIEGTRIAAVGPTGTLVVPTTARSFDLSGTTIVPGLIDVHMHAWESRRGVLDTNDWALRANLAYGVTSIRDPQTTTVDTFAYQDLVDTGTVIGPRIYTTGPGIGSAELPSWQATLDVLERHKRYYRTHIVKAYVAGNRQQRRWFADASRTLGLLATAEGAGDFYLDLTHALDGYSGNEHNLPVIDLYDDVAQLFARRNLTYTPTLLVGHGGPGAMDAFVSQSELLSDRKLRRFLPPIEREAKLTRAAWYADQEQIYKRLASSAAKVIAAGGRVCVGGHGVVHGLSTHWELWALQRGGLTTHEAIRAATLLGAEALGVEQDLGSIATGKLADLVILDKNPLENIENTTSIRFVMKGGQLYDGQTLSELWPVQRPAWTPWWEANDR